MKIRLSGLATHRRMTRPLLRYSALALAGLLVAGCSAQPMTVEQELTTGAVAGMIGGGSGALFAAASGKSYPISIAIGAAGVAGVVLLYEEIKREAALESSPAPPPIPPAAPSAPSNNP
jgi:hypothetical protein